MADTQFGFEGAVEYRGVFEFSVADDPSRLRESAVRDNVLRAGSALRELHELIPPLLADPFIAPGDKVSRVAAERERVAAIVAKERSWLPKAECDLLQDEAILYTPPEIESGDVAGALRDERRQAWFEGLDTNARAAWEDEMRSGQHPGYAASLARSPVPGVAQSVGRSAYRAEVAASDPVRSRALESRRNEILWANAHLDAMTLAVAANPWATRRPETVFQKMTPGRAGRVPVSSGERYGDAGGAGLATLAANQRKT